LSTRTETLMERCKVLANLLSRSSRKRKKKRNGRNRSGLRRRGEQLSGWLRMTAPPPAQPTKIKTKWENLRLYLVRQERNLRKRIRRSRQVPRLGLRVRPRRKRKVAGRGVLLHLLVVAGGVGVG
ncbi:hypothetical protein HK097_004908, partial [Rhizophlyctis rosea]